MELLPDGVAFAIGKRKSVADLSGCSCRLWAACEPAMNQLQVASGYSARVAVHARDLKGDAIDFHEKRDA